MEHWISEATWLWSIVIKIIKWVVETLVYENEVLLSQSPLNNII